MAKSDVSTSISLSENPSFSARAATGANATSRNPYSVNVIGTRSQSHMHDDRDAKDVMISVSTEVHQESFIGKV